MREELGYGHKDPGLTYFIKFCAIQSVGPMLGEILNRRLSCLPHQPNDLFIRALLLLYKLALLSELGTGNCIPDPTLVMPNGRSKISL